MQLSLKGFTQLVEDMSAALQSSASSLVDVSIGSVIRALFEANASVVLWLQWLLLQVLQTTRAATSTGSDLDTWMMDFGLERLAAVPASGIATFSRFVTNLPASVPVGSLVKTADGSLTFRVSEDNTLSIWQSASSSYVIPVGVAAADLPIVCLTSGTTGNVLGGSINVIASSLPGIDSVTNATSLLDGIDAESDVAFRNRFQGYLASRSRATLPAVTNAVACVQQNLRILVKENTGLDGATKVGAFLVVLDDGSGYPAASLLSSAADAIDKVRPIGTTFAVVAPTVLVVNVALTVQFASNDGLSSAIGSVREQVTAYLNCLGIGRSASITRVAQRAYVAGLGIENVTNVTLNGSTVDITPSPSGVIKAGQIVVSANGG